MGRSELENLHSDLNRFTTEAGSLDVEALASAAGEDLDGALELLVDLAKATNVNVRRDARRLALRLTLSSARTGMVHRAGAARLRTVSDPLAGVDLDLDATLARVDVSPRLRAEDLRVRAWRTPATAYVVLLDASGSVAGSPISAALVTAAALSARMSPGDQLAVVVFWSQSVVLRAIGSTSPADELVEALLTLRCGGTTDLGLGLRTALRQATSARPVRRELLLLSDGIVTAGLDPLPLAREAPSAGARLHVLRLSEEPDSVSACSRLARAGGGRHAPLLRPSDAPAAISHVLAR